MRILSSFDLKLIALVTMIIDHVGFIFFPKLIVLRIIGRVAFILYAFMLVEGFFHTGNFKKYILKVFLWALISEIPFDLAFHGKWFYPNDQNIFFTLFLALAGMYFLEKNSNPVRQVLIICGTLFLAVIFKVDYLWYGVLTIILFYYLRKFPIKFVAITLLNIFASLKLLAVQFFAFLGFIPIILYNGKRGRKMGNIYYSFYAIHLTIFAILKQYFLKS